MTQNVVLAVTARLAASLIALFALLTPALSAERAVINFIGYDEDSHYLAFEQYGQNDGTGGYYDDIFVIDLVEDAWVKGVPFSFRDESEDASMRLSEVRAKAMALALPTIKSLGIDAPVQILALNGDGINGDRSTLTWFTPNCCGVDSTEDKPFTLTLTENPIAEEDSGDCANLVGEGIVGFTLAYEGDGDKSELHSDGATVPKSRGCTLGYGIYAVIQPLDRDGGRVAIIESWPFGFEGPDRRFLAIPIDGHV